MKTNKSLAVAVILLATFGSNAFAVLRSPYPVQASPPDRIIVISAEKPDSVRIAVRVSQ